MRTSAVIASFIALAASAPLDLPAFTTLPVDGVPAVTGLPNLPEVGLPNLPVGIPELPVKRELLEVEAADVVDIEVDSPLPVKRVDLPELGLDELELPTIPKVALPNLPEVSELPNLRVKRDLPELDLPTLSEVGIPELSELELPSLPEIDDLPVEVPELPVKRDGLGLPALPGVALPEEVKNLLNEVKLPVKRTTATVTDKKIEARIEEAIELLTSVIKDIDVPEASIVASISPIATPTPTVNVPELPVKRDGLGLPAVPGLALPELDTLELGPTLSLVVNILTGLLA